MIELWDMQDNVKIVVSEFEGNNILRFNNYESGGRYIPIEKFGRYFDPVQEESEPAVIEAIVEKMVDPIKQVFEKELPKEPKPKATRTTKPKTNQKASK